MEDMKMKCIHIILSFYDFDILNGLFQHNYAALEGN